MIKECIVLEQEIASKLQALIPLIETMQKAANNQRELREYADIALTCREVEEKLEDFIKRLRAVSYVAQENACKGMEELNISKIRSDYCTAVPNPRLWFKIPYKRDINPEAYDAIMESIGVSLEASMMDLVRIHAPGLMDYCTYLIGEGKNPPNGINPKECTSAELRLKIIKRRA